MKNIIKWQLIALLSIFSCSVPVNQDNTTTPVKPAEIPSPVTITVKPEESKPPVQSIKTVDSVIAYPSSLVMRIGEKFSIFGTVKYSDKSFNNKLVYSSSDISLLNVDEKGAIEAKAEGFGSINIASKDDLTKISTIKVQIKNNIEPYKIYAPPSGEANDGGHISTLTGLSDSGEHLIFSGWCKDECNKSYSKLYKFNMMGNLETYEEPKTQNISLLEKYNLLYKNGTKLKSEISSQEERYVLNSNGDAVTLKLKSTSESFVIDENTTKTINTYNLFGQKLNLNENTESPSFRVNTQDVRTQYIYKKTINDPQAYIPSIPSETAIDKKGNFAIVWLETGAYLARLYNSDGTPKTDIFEIARVKQNNEPFKLLVSPNGTKYMLFTGYDTGRALIFNTDGELQGKEITVRPVPDNFSFYYMKNSISNAFAGINDNGDFIAVWNNTNSSFTSGNIKRIEYIIAQEFSMDGTPKGKFFTVNVYPESYTYKPGTVLLNNNGDFTISWNFGTLIMENGLRYYKSNNNIEKLNNLISLKEKETIDLKNNSKVKELFGNDDITLINSDSFLVKTENTSITGLYDGLTEITVISKQNPEKFIKFTVKVNRDV